MDHATSQQLFGSARPQPIDMTFDNRGDRLLGLGLVNGLLKIATLGLYSFWGKTEVRRRLWSFTRLNGEPLEYTGTGKELFLGFLIAFVLVTVPIFLGAVVVAMLFAGNPVALIVYQGLVYLIILLLIGNAIYRAQRYRLSRTRWRGIRGALIGSPQRYGWAYFWTLAVPFIAVAVLAGLAAYVIAPKVGYLTVFLGFIAALWMLPWRANKLQGMITKDICFGDRGVTYDGGPGPLYKRYTFAWIGSVFAYFLATALTVVYVLHAGIATRLAAKIPPAPREILTVVAIWFATLIAIAMITSWYRAHQMNHFARHTHFEGATFRLQASGSGLMWLVLSNWLITGTGLLAGVALGFAFAAALGGLPENGAGNLTPAEPGALTILSFAGPVVLLSTITATFAQFRSVRHFMSRLKLDGPVDLGRVMQSDSRSPKRGEGLAQVFDIDAL